VSQFVRARIAAVDCLPVCTALVRCFDIAIKTNGEDHALTGMHRRANAAQSRAHLPQPPFTTLPAQHYRFALVSLVRCASGATEVHQVTRMHPARVSSATGLKSIVPALLMRMSSEPKELTAA
jgi:hypothetical protein